MAGSDSIPVDRMEREGSKTGCRRNIRVFARIRPTLPREEEEVDGLEVPTDEQQPRDLIINNSTGEKKQFAVDYVFDSRRKDVTQERVFDGVGSPLVAESLRGYNICMFAYGHTGSGKTFTMLGDGTRTAGSVPESFSSRQGNGAGLLPRFIDAVFSSLSNQKQEPHFTCEYYEVYNEQIRDLLVPTNAERKRVVHVHPKYGVRINGLCTSVVKSADEVLDLVHFGNQMRTVAATTMNERSSRSHAIFAFKFAMESKVSETDEPMSPGRDITHRESTVLFVDLAGREDQLASTNKEDRFREMCHINTSLFHLTHLISKLAEGTANKGALTDFRNSKLTLLLSQALVGNSTTALVATLAPPEAYYEDTLATLNFAQKVKKIETRPLINNKSSKAVLSDLENEVRSLKRQLGEANVTGSEKEQELITLKNMIKHYQLSWQEAWAQSQHMNITRATTLSAMGLCERRCYSGGCSAMMKVDDRFVPFFTKLSDDASLQGLCNYFLTRPVFTIGSDPHCDIVLHGVGIKKGMCEVRIQGEDGRVTVELSSPELREVDEESISDRGTNSDSGSIGKEQTCSGAIPKEPDKVPRVLINGEALSRHQQFKVLEHGDCLILGYAHAFRLVVPTEERLADNKVDDPTDFARSCLPSLDMDTAISEIQEERGEFKEVFPYLRQLKAHVSETVVEELLKTFRYICPLVDEANTLTKEVFSDQKLRFELHVLTDLFTNEDARPKLVVGVLQNSAVGWWGASAGLSSCNATPTNNTPQGALRGRANSDCRRNSFVSGAAPLGILDNMLGRQGDQMLYVWTLDKFLRRLDEMRDVYQECTEMCDGFTHVQRRLKAKPFLNPWQEMAFAEVKVLAVEQTGSDEEQTPISSGRPSRVGDLQGFRDASSEQTNSALAVDLTIVTSGGATSSTTSPFVSPVRIDSTMEQPPPQPHVQAGRLTSGASLSSIGTVSVSPVRPRETSPPPETRSFAQGTVGGTGIRSLAKITPKVVQGEYAAAPSPEPGRAFVPDPGGGLEELNILRMELRKCAWQAPMVSQQSVGERDRFALLLDRLERLLSNTEANSTPRANVASVVPVHHHVTGVFPGGVDNRYAAQAPIPSATNGAHRPRSPTCPWPMSNGMPMQIVQAAQTIPTLLHGQAPTYGSPWPQRTTTGETMIAACGDRSPRCTVAQMPQAASAYASPWPQRAATGEAMVAPCGDRSPRCTVPQLQQAVLHAVTQGVTPPMTPVTVTRPLVSPRTEGQRPWRWGD
eukprot:TRINITY_DN8834_c0_g1_i1.p1 TRINITY_DN8834_c0_g1~~TRINITY_DN8834_c0_g1_i1.p1  ORF type:complete len:1456 (-),score=214.57 TRINITY_DN8834_c0_g1_i1:122-3880(-)